MKIDISKEEYRDLLDVLHMADWVMHAHETEKALGTEKYDRIIQKFYALAKDMGQSDLIEYDPKLKEYFPTREFDDAAESWEFIEDFTDETFWDELIHRLTDRDVARKVGGYEQMSKLNMTERFAHEGPVLERYSHEFEENGLDRLEIVDQFAPTSGTQMTTHD